MSNSESVIQRHLDAFNNRNTEEEPWTDGAEMVAPGATVSGRADVLGFLGVFQEAFPDGRLSLVKIISEGSSAAVEGRVTGTHDGVLHTPDGDVPASGRSVDFRWSAAYETTGDELASEHLYFDQLDFLTQLGLMPAE